MVSIHRYHEISEANHQILNPLTRAQLELVGEICALNAGMRQLDLASGKGEMLCQYAARHGITGVGVDVYPPFAEVATARAQALGVDGAVRFVVGDATSYDDEPSSYDVVSCIGATWIGGGLDGTLRMMRQWIEPRGWLLVGEPSWIEPPPPEVRAGHEFTQIFADLAGTLERFEAADTDLVEMVLADTESWDRYSASQWLNVANWLVENPDDPDAADVRQIRDDSRKSYLQHERRCLGWGVFALRLQE